jgi:hypothetical protein
MVPRKRILTIRFTGSSKEPLSHNFFGEEAVKVWEHLTKLSERVSIPLQAPSA